MYLDPALVQISAPAQVAFAPQAAATYRERRANRIAFDMLVRYAWRGVRATVMLKDLTPFGARIEGIEALRKGDGLTLLLPGQPATEATVAWTDGHAAGLVFDLPLEHIDFVVLTRDFATARPDFTPDPSSSLRRAA